MITFSQPAKSSPSAAPVLETDPVQILARAMREHMSAYGSPTDEDLALKTNMEVEEVRRLASQARPIAFRMMNRQIGEDS